MSIPPDDPTPNPGTPSRRRTPRGLDDLASRFEKEDDRKPEPASAQPPAEPGSDRQARLNRARSAFSALIEENDAPAPEPAPPHADRERHVLAALSDPPETTPPDEARLPEAAPAPPKRRQTRGRAALDSLFDQPETGTPPAGKSTPGSSRSALLDEGPEVASQGLKIPADLEHYLPPETWRKLNSSSPRRGVLISGLERLRSIQYLLSTFLPAHLVQEKLRRPVPGLVNGQMLHGSLLFSDVSGFTAMSERLAVLGPEGAERLTSTMNRYFTTMLEILSWSGGVLIKFAGDATLVYFPEQQTGAQAAWAVRAAQRMLRAMNQFENLDVPGEKVSLRMKIGIATGEFLAASIGSASRMEYAVLGPAVTRTLGAEGASTGPGQLIVDASTAALLDVSFTYTPQAPGYSLISHADRPLDDFEIRAEQRRARGAIPWSASPQAIVAQMQVTARQIQALAPFLAPELVDRVVAHAQHRHVESEFRPTTVMFMNFTGPEQLLETWGEPGLQRLTGILSAYFNAMHEVIARYGGIVSRIDPYSKGTKILVLFGAPVSHEDDPQRAASAALSMNLELDALNERLRQKYARYLPESLDGPLIQHRIGITSGTTFAGQVGSQNRREYTVMGDDVNLAARLMGAGKPGQILISPAVYTAIKDYFVFTPLAPIRVKGKSKPIAITQVDGPRDRTLDTRIGARAPLIGRQAELKRASQVLERALAGRPALLTVQGPPGIGKSHLADVVLQQALAQNVRLLSTQCQSYHAATPYAAWGNLLRSLAGITVLDLPQVYPDKLERFVNRQKLEGSLAQSLGKLMGLTPVSPRRAEKEEPAAASAAEKSSLDSLVELKQGRRQRRASSLDLLQQIEQPKITDAGVAWQTLPAELKGQERRQVYADVVTLLEKLLAASALALFFEDAHWLDSASQDLLRYVLNHVDHAPLFILLAQRPVESEGAQPGTLLDLEPLDQQGTHELVSHILVSELARLIYAQSGGSPLLIEEITRWIQRTRKVSPSDLRDVLQSSDILQKLVLSNLETLPEMQREVARVAAVIGNEFRVGELQAVLASDVDPVTLSGHLRGLVAAQIISQSESGVDARYAFQQSLVRDILYNSLPFERRRAQHERIAQYLSAPPAARSAVHNRIAAFLEARSEPNPAQQSEVIAYHYERAEQYLPAANHLLNAAQHARTNLDYSRAAALYQNGLACLDKIPAGAPDAALPPLRARLLIGSADMALQAGEYLGALSAYENARAILPPDLSPDVLARFFTNLALVLPTQGRAAEAVEILQHALESLEFFTQPAGRSGVEADLELAAPAALAWLLWRTGSPQLPAWLASSRELANQRSGPWAKKIKVLLNDLAGAEETASEAYQSLNLVPGAALLAIRQGDRDLEAQAPRQAQQHYQQAAQLWGGRKKDPSGLFLAQFRLAQAAWQSAEAGAARTALNEAQVLLPSVLPALRQEWRAALKTAAKVLGGKARKWPNLPWQPLDDVFRINLLFRI